jgi:GntR family transcriptional regulator
MPDTLNKTPVYQQLNQLLRELVRRGEYASGARFLTERQICERFDVSRATANKALSNLVAEGTLEFRKGIGTFVRGGALQYDTRTLASFTEKARAAGKLPSTRLLQWQRVAARTLTAHVQQTLQLGPADAAFSVERLRLADNVPVILERRQIVARFCPDLVRDDLEGSLYAVWVQKYGLELGGADEVIRAVLVRNGEARLLEVRSGAPCFLIHATGYLADGAPLWWEETWYRGDMYEFHNRLGPMPGARSVTGALR